jgi:hypothetical protein
MDEHMRRLQKGKPESEQQTDEAPEEGEIADMLAELQHGKGRVPPIEEVPVGEERYEADSKEGEEDPSHSEMGHTTEDPPVDTEANLHDQNQEIHHNRMGEMGDARPIARDMHAQAKTTKKKGVRF